MVRDRIGIFYNPLSPSAVEFGEELETWIKAEGIATWRGAPQDVRDIPAPLTECSLLVCLGGDGTALRAARVAIPYSTPMLPVALGHLSFMAEVTPEEVRPSIKRIMANDFWIDERTLAWGRLEPVTGEAGEWTALNEILIGRGDLARAIVVEVSVDNVPMTEYHADGIIVSTATGSTAYALAAGGPVLDPRSHVLSLVSIAPHLTNVPALVLHEDAEIRLRLRSRYPASLSVDGQISVPVQLGDVITVRRSPQVARFARVRSPEYFYQTLIQRLRRS